MIKLDLYNKTNAHIKEKIFLYLLDCAEKTLIREKKMRKGEVYLLELSLVGNKSITALNKLYHKKDCPTDVISLSYLDPGAKKKNDDFVGEIFISLPYARAQAKQIGQSWEDELRFLFVHGLLHVFGYDHMVPKEEAHMLELTYGILAR